MADLEAVSLTPEQYEKGIDFLPEGEMRELVKEAIKVWREERHYELASTNQVNPTFFHAARQLGKIIITR